MRLFLSSSFKDAANIFENFEKDLSGKTVTFIPTASVVEKVKFYVKSGRKKLESMGMVVDELEISTATSDEIATKLAVNDYIYITGGNTYFLLQELIRTGADKLIIDYVRRGKLYIGESAGSMITSPDISYVKYMDSPQKAPTLTDYTALGLVDFYTIPHYTNPPFKKAAGKMFEAYSSNLNVIPICNKQAILINDNDIKVEQY